MPAPGRTATVVLVHEGEVVGALPPVALELPWWPEAHDLVTAVRERDGLEITVLRLLRAEAGRTSGGEVCYLAETGRPPPRTSLVPCPGDPLADEPLRQRWARPGGPAALLTWADDRLAAHGRHRTGPAQQMRTWNLSAMWRVPTAAGAVWLKAVPDFFAHEGAVLDWVGPPVAPSLVDFTRGQALIAEVEHADNHAVREEQALRPMVALLTGLQQRALDRLDELSALGVPDRRLPAMVPRIAAVVEQWGDGLPIEQRRVVDALVAGLPARLAAVERCGVPDSLVHGDYHPGNVAGRGGDHVILDWGDSFVGHPLLDELAFVQRLPPASRLAARTWFVDDWQRVVPGAEVARAARLLEPVASLLGAVTYAGFCAAIEPDERVYHASDVLRLLEEAALVGSP